MKRKCIFRKLIMKNERRDRSSVGTLDLMIWFFITKVIKGSWAREIKVI